MKWEYNKDFGFLAVFNRKFNFGTWYRSRDRGSGTCRIRGRGFGGPKMFRGRPGPRVSSTFRFSFSLTIFNIFPDHSMNSLAFAEAFWVDLRMYHLNRERRRRAKNLCIYSMYSDAKISIFILLWPIQKCSPTTCPNSLTPDFSRPRARPILPIGQSIRHMRKLLKRH